MEQLKPGDKIVGGSVPFDELSGYLKTFREEGLSDVELRDMISKMGIVMKKEKGPEPIHGGPAESDIEGWMTALRDGGFSKEEVDRILNRVCAKDEACITSFRKIEVIHHNEHSVGEEIPVIVR